MLPDGDDLLGMTAHTPGELAQVGCHPSMEESPSDEMELLSRFHVSQQLSKLCMVA